MRSDRMSADDTVICAESGEQVEEGTKRWRSTLERRQMKVSRAEKECVCEFE